MNIETKTWLGSWLGRGRDYERWRGNISIRDLSWRHALTLDSGAGQFTEKYSYRENYFLSN